MLLATLPETKAVAVMSKEQFENERLYQLTMGFVRSLLEKGLISSDDYAIIDTIFLEKYRPSLGTLFSENPLT